MDVKKYIHGFDPGITTGYVLYKIETCEVIGHEALTGYKEISKVLNGIDKTTDIVVFEKPVGKIVTSDQLQMAMYCGFIEGYCESNDIESIPQAPMVRTGYRKMSLDYLKRHTTGYVIHNVDALSHVLKYLSNEERKRFIERL